MLPSYVHSQHLQCYNCNIIVKILLTLQNSLETEGRHYLCLNTHYVNTQKV